MNSVHRSDEEESFETRVEKLSLDCSGTRKRANDAFSSPQTVKARSNSMVKRSLEDISTAVPDSESPDAVKKEAMAKTNKRRRVESRDPSHDAIREEMTRSILASMQRTASSDASAKRQQQISVKQLESFVVRAEEVLYKSSSSIESYADKTTIKNRLKTLVQAILHVKARKTTAKTTSQARKRKAACSVRNAENCTRERVLALRNLLGDEDYEEALYLFQEIVKIRKTAFSWMFVDFDRHGGTPRSQSASVFMDIYHRVPLVDAFHRLMSGSNGMDRRGDHMDKQTWCNLISQATTALARYRDLEAEVLSAANVSAEEARMMAMTPCCARKGACPLMMRGGGLHASN